MIISTPVLSFHFKDSLLASTLTTLRNIEELKSRTLITMNPTNDDDVAGGFCRKSSLNKTTYSPNSGSDQLVLSSPKTAVVTTKLARVAS
jgi:hypothetical protein